MGLKFGCTFQIFAANEFIQWFLRVIALKQVLRPLLIDLKIFIYDEIAPLP